MKLTLSHGDVLAGICSFLAGRGLTGFDPNTVHAEFTKGRDGKLSVVLDDEAPVDAESKQPKAKAGEAKAVPTTDAASDVKKDLPPADKADAAAAEVPANGPVTSAQVESAEVAETATTTGEAVATEAAPAGDAENLFG